MTRGLAMGLALLLLSAPVAWGEVRRLEVEGQVSASGETAADTLLRAAALDAALARAVAEVARELAFGLPGVDPERDWIAALGGDPKEFTVRYRILEDRGLGPSPERAGPGALQVYAVRVEVHVDAARVAQRLRKGGWPVGAALPVAVEVFRLELREVPSYRAYAAFRTHLLEQGGARRAVPERMEPGRAVLRVEAPGGPAALLGRLLRAPPEGLRLEPLAAGEGLLALRIEALAPPAPALEAGPAAIDTPR